MFYKGPSMAKAGVCTNCPVVFKDEGALYIAAYLADVAATLGPGRCRPGGFGASAPREAAADSPNLENISQGGAPGR